MDLTRHPEVSLKLKEPAYHLNSMKTRESVSYHEIMSHMIHEILSSVNVTRLLVDCSYNDQVSKNGFLPYSLCQMYIRGHIWHTCLHGPFVGSRKSQTVSDLTLIIAMV